MTDAPTLYDEIGPDLLRRVVVDFYDRVFSDIMIGFLFVGKDRQRLIDKEVEFAARMLGGPAEYTGRPIRQAHAQSPILGGHFDRRLQILKDVMEDQGVPDAVRTRWVEHTNALRSAVTDDTGSQCDHDVSEQRLRRGISEGGE